MKKSKIVTLVLITAALASCHRSRRHREHSSMWLRSDESADYAYMDGYADGQANTMLWYYAFRPYGNYTNGHYTRAGYYSSSISESSNIGHSSFKSNVVRGGFGGGSHSVSS